ncbi:MAG: hypothetical protein MJ213_05270 [Bacilli bacterium]|nr:hypothetical protein [Bacilli bacterium]
MDSDTHTHPSIDEVKTYIDSIKHDGLSIRYKEITYFEYSVVKDDKDKHNPTTYCNQTYKIALEEKNLNDEIYTIDDGTNLYTLKDALYNKLEILNVKDEDIRVYTNTVYNVPNNIGIVALSTMISLATFTVYLLIRRFRGSRVLSVFVTSSVGATLTLGFISLARVVATPVLSISMVLTMLVTVMMTLFILHKDKDLIKEERLKDVATRKVVLKKANAMALVPLLAFALISVYTAINFFGFGHKEFLALFFSSAFGMVMTVVILLTWFAPMCNLFDERFSRMKLPQIKLRKKDKSKVKSNTPEEAIFIGIND